MFKFIPSASGRGGSWKKGESMNSKVVAMVAIIIVMAAAAAVVLTRDGGEDGTVEGVTVTDSSGREVFIPTPVERVAITDPTIVEIFAQAVGEGWEDYVCLLPQDIETREPAKWALLKETYPELADVPLCPDVYGTGSIPVDDILNSEPDLVLLAGSTVNYLPGAEDQMAALGDIPSIYLEFYDKSFTDGIAEANYGILGEIFGRQSVADRIVDYYNEKVSVAKDRIASADRSFTYYVELPGSDASIYGSVVAMGCPEFDILGGTNVCSNPAGVDMEWNIEKMLQSGDGGPDYIVLISTPYYNGPATLGYGSTATAEDIQKSFEPYLERAGWDNLNAVEEGNVMINYGELRNSALGLIDLYSVAAMIYPDLFTLEEVEQIAEDLDAMTPFGFEGVWYYHVGA